ncbi:hypothetical protein Mal48_10160 [Thalassoglobus polymorphus]|uniref:Uncharacterized protein n=1 Tax=Thalassoglobus polymorphus TaxID=2527994 RepID=A0A517QJG0_9PLAN|nr:hypothetical protein Mal48_10160 [Thalassoglobus polymorphus]
MLLRAFSMLVVSAKSSLVIQRLLFTRQAEPKSDIELTLNLNRSLVLGFSSID